MQQYEIDPLAVLIQGFLLRVCTLAAVQIACSYD